MGGRANRQRAAAAIVGIARTEFAGRTDLPATDVHGHAIVLRPA